MTSHAIRTIIVDDEKGARETLNNMLTIYCPEVLVEHQANTVSSATKCVQQASPDLIFLDVEMPGGSGFELLPHIKPEQTKIIFTTAYSHYALAAIKASALDYLLKPLDVDELTRAVKRYKHNVNPAAMAQYMLLNDQYLKAEQDNITRLAIPTPHGYDIVKTDNILFCEGEGNYTNIFMMQGTKHVSSKTLKEYEKILPKKKFVRIHQKYIANIDYIQKYLKGRGGTVVMEGGHHLAVSQNRKNLLVDVLTN